MSNAAWGRRRQAKRRRMMRRQIARIFDVPHRLIASGGPTYQNAADEQATYYGMLGASSYVWNATSASGVWQVLHPVTKYSH